MNSAAAWSMSGAVRIYPPWAILGWYAHYAGRYPKAFDMASLWGLAAAMIPVGMAIGVARRFRRSPPAFGADAWARRGGCPARQADRSQGGDHAGACWAGSTADT